MSARNSRAAASTAERRTALRRTLAIGVGLGTAALPMVQATGSALAFDLESAEAELDLEEELEEEGALDGEFADAKIVDDADEIDGVPGTYELSPEGDGEPSTLTEPLEGAEEPGAEDNGQLEQQPEAEPETGS